MLAVGGHSAGPPDFCRFLNTDLANFVGTGSMTDRRDVNHYGRIRCRAVDSRRFSGRVGMGRLLAARGRQRRNAALARVFGDMRFQKSASACFGTADADRCQVRFFQCR